MPCKLGSVMSSYFKALNWSASTWQQKFPMVSTAGWRQERAESHITLGIPKETLGFRTMETNVNTNFKYSQGTFPKRNWGRRVGEDVNYIRAGRFAYERNWQRRRGTSPTKANNEHARGKPALRKWEKVLAIKGHVRHRNLCAQRHWASHPPPSSGPCPLPSGKQNCLLLLLSRFLF